MELIDGQWLKARLSGRHGELKKLADAVGLEPDKITKIIKGQRQIKGSEIPKFLAYFHEEILSVHAAFQEDASEFVEVEPLPTLSNPGLVAAIAPAVTRPMVYYARRDYPAAGLLNGDMMVVDSEDHDSDGLVLATLWHPNGGAETLVRRKVGAQLLALDPLDPQPVIQITDGPEIGLLGLVTTVLRKSVLGAR